MFRVRGTGLCSMMFSADVGIGIMKGSFCALFVFYRYRHYVFLRGRTGS